METAVINPVDTRGLGLIKEQIRKRPYCNTPIKLVLSTHQKSKSGINTHSAGSGRSRSVQHQFTRRLRFATHRINYKALAVKKEIDETFHHVCCDNLLEVNCESSSWRWVFCWICFPNRRTDNRW